MKTVGIRFRPAGKVYNFDPAEIDLAPNDRVVVETERGMAIGIVAWPPLDVEEPPAQPLKKILRAAEERDILRGEENIALQREARETAQRLVADKGLDMKLLSVELYFDRSKMIFFFASEGRVDFRELVRDLARQFHTRIEMRQLGVRDEAKMVGGLGCCGRELCCATFLTEFAPISVRMAKSQNISLNPAKISGICGRLMCCLSYENKMYEDLTRNMPKIGKRVMTPKGEGKVVRRNALDGTYVVFTNEGEVELSVEEVNEVKLEAPPSEEPRRAPPPEEESSAGEEPQEGVDEAPEEEVGAEEGAESGEAAPGEGEGAGQSKSQNRRRRRRRRKPPQEREKKSDG